MTDYFMRVLQKFELKDYNQITQEEMKKASNEILYELQVTQSKLDRLKENIKCLKLISDKVEWKN